MIIVQYMRHYLDYRPNTLYFETMEAAERDFEWIKRLPDLKFVLMSEGGHLLRSYTPQKAERLP